MVDGIYPKYSILVSTIAEPVNNKESLSAKVQEAVRKDVERAFGALKGRWHIIQQPSMIWDAEEMRYIVLACVILPNMIVEEGAGDVEDFCRRGDLTPSRRTRRLLSGEGSPR